MQPSGDNGTRTLRRRIRFVAHAMLCYVAITLAPQAATAEATAPIRILGLGDSLMQGYGLSPGSDFPAQLEERLRADGLDVRVINAGVSGDTTAGGLSRVDWSLSEPPDAVIVELGGNDALRGLSPEETEKNLDAILAKFKASGTPVLLAGMMAPRNLGPDYVAAFDSLYPRLAEKYDVIFYPFFLEGVALDPKLNQGDGNHPNSQGVAVIVERIAPLVRELVASAQSRRAASHP